jgi:hypothetical protein
VTDLVSKGYTVEEIKIAGYNENAMLKGGVSKTDYQRAVASVAAASAAASKGGLNTAVAIVIVLIVLVIVGALVYVKLSPQGGAAVQQPGSFENPMYAATTSIHGGAEPAYMDPVAQQQQQPSSGYMDVGENGGSSGYMDVNVAPAASNDGFGDDSDDEEV